MNGFHLVTVSTTELHHGINRSYRTRMRLCTTLTFDGDPVRLAARVHDLEAAGVDMVLISEIYGFDQVWVLRSSPRRRSGSD